MDTLSDYLDKKRADDIVNEIIELKYDKSADHTYTIQKLQQELDALEKKINRIDD